MSDKFVLMNGLGNRLALVRGALVNNISDVTEVCSRLSKDYLIDGLVIVSPYSPGVVRMEYWNSDGSRAEMCGNGLRCAARFAIREGMVENNEFIVQTDVGPLRVICQDGSSLVKAQTARVKLSGSTVSVGGLEFYIADAGNPHAVTFVDDLDLVDVERLGPIVENDDIFPNKTNVEFVKVEDDGSLSLRVWERGVGETLACGTGMVASACVANKNKGVPFPLKIRVRGGVATSWLDDEGFVWLEGPAEFED
jgi:diaminopimelate epimerase